MTSASDLLIVGGGPSGLAAAITAASEGLSVQLLDRGPTLGGQAKQSAAIENYPGFPKGLTGMDFMSRLTEQAVKFGVALYCPQTIAEVDYSGQQAEFLTTDGYAFTGRATLIATGLQYRRLDVPGISRLLGRGIFYGMPAGRLSHCHICIVGGANSAGQAVVKLASYPGVSITMIVRHTLERQMSAYLIERIRNLGNVEVLEGAEVVSCFGQARLEGLTLSTGTAVPARHAFIFIGASPHTLWLRKALVLDPKGYVYTGLDAQQPIPYKTSCRSVFAAGDVRANSVKRIATGAGEGVSAVQSIHHFLEETK